MNSGAQPRTRLFPASQQTQREPEMGTENLQDPLRHKPFMVWGDPTVWRHLVWTTRPLKAQLIPYTARDPFQYWKKTNLGFTEGRGQGLNVGLSIFKGESKQYILFWCHEYSLWVAKYLDSSRPWLSWSRAVPGRGLWKYFGFCKQLDSLPLLCKGDCQEGC